MKSYASHLTTNQTQPIFGRTDMVKNNAGAYVFQASDLERLDRFLFLGSDGGTYYVSEQKLTVDNTTNVINLIRTNGLVVVKRLIEVSEQRLTPRATATLFTLALCIKYGNKETRSLAFRSISKICTVSTNLFIFLQNLKELDVGWSRGLRKGVADFYISKSVHEVAYQLVKYRQREGWTHRDVLRLCHVKALHPKLNQLLKYAVGKIDESESGSELIEAFGKAKNAHTKDLINLVSNSALTWEMIPTEHLNNRDVLATLVSKMPLNALLRNLNRFSYTGLTSSFLGEVRTIKQRLLDKEATTKSKIHPIQVINTLCTYSKGRGEKGSKTWEVNETIVDSLCSLYDNSLGNITPTNKRILIGCDVSGSMNHDVGGMSMTAAQISQVLANTILKTEPNANVLDFTDQLIKNKYGRRTPVDQIVKGFNNGGGTDCSLPIYYALETKQVYDAIVIFTDNETWAGKQHGLVILNKYKKINPNVKVVEVALVANPTTLLPEDKNTLRVVGFDASVIQVINNFIGNSGSL